MKIAERFGVLPSDENLLKAWRNPYWRALYIAVIHEMRTDTQAIYKLVGEQLFEHLTRLIDWHGTVVAKSAGAKIHGKTLMGSMDKGKSSIQPTEGRRILGQTVDPRTGEVVIIESNL